MNVSQIGAVIIALLILAAFGLCLYNIMQVLFPMSGEPPFRIIIEI